MSDATRQCAYKGKPQFNYEGDSKPGEVLGDWVGGVWSVAVP